MESDKLYRVQKEDLPKVEKMLNQCFAHDPLYETLIPDPEVRKNLMPELFKCDMDEFYATCEIFADSADLNSVLVVSDEAEPYNVFQFYFTEAMAALHADGAGLDGDAALALEVHVVEQLLLHLADGDRLALLQQAVGKGGLAVVDMRNNRKIANLLTIFHVESSLSD